MLENILTIISNLGGKDKAIWHELIVIVLILIYILRFIFGLRSI